MASPLIVRLGHRVGASLLKVIHRLLQFGIVAALSLGIRRRDPSVILNGVLSLILVFLPQGLTHKFGVRFDRWQRLWISAAGLIHTVGMLGPYDRVWWWDHLAHTLSGVVVGGAVDVYLRGTAVDVGRSAISERHRSLSIFGLTLGLGVLWEILEYLIHAVADRVGIEPLLVHYGQRDAVGDLFFDAVGAGIVIAFGRRALSNVVESVPNELARTCEQE